MCSIPSPYAGISLLLQPRNPLPRVPRFSPFPGSFQHWAPQAPWEALPGLGFPQDQQVERGMHTHRWDSHCAGSPAVRGPHAGPAGCGLSPWDPLNGIPRLHRPPFYRWETRTHSVTRSCGPQGRSWDSNPAQSHPKGLSDLIRAP